MKIEEIQNYIASEKADAWCIYDYECTNPNLIGLLGKRFLTRKCFVIIPVKGKPYIICHQIDKVQFKDIVDYDFIIYKNWNQLLDSLKDKMTPYKNVLMEITENGILPHSSYVDYGTACLFKSFGLNLLSSANLAQYFDAVFDGESYDLFMEAAKKCDEIKDLAFKYIKGEIAQNGKVSEYDVQQYIMKLFKDNSMVTDSEPIVARGNHANDPHYAPSLSDFDYIVEGDLVLIDLWAKYDKPKAVFGDITWMGYVGTEVPSIYKERFDIVKESIDAALAFLNDELPKRKVYGYEVDDLVRSVIAKYHYQDYFIHRTGHSISIANSSHGTGVNIDGYETHDERELIDKIAFSIEPGIYAEDFGIREEIDVYILNRKPIVASRRQKEIVAIMSL